MEVVINGRKESHRFEVGAGENILYAALRSGLEVPHECASGTCGTCRAKVVDGSALVDAWADAPGKAGIPEGSGRILMCQTRCEGPAELRVLGAMRRRGPGEINPDYFDAKVVDPVLFTDDVVGFGLRPDRELSYRPGQFVMFQVPGVDGWRGYSMTTAAGKGGVLSFVVKQKPGGGVTGWLFERTRIGRPARAGPELRVFGPLGRACLDPPGAREPDDGDVVAIAGGSGIAGIMSVLGAALDGGYLGRHRARLFFGVRTMEDVFFQDRLSVLTLAGAGAVEVTVAVSDEAVREGELPGFPELRLARGLVHEVAGRSLAESPADDRAIFFLAGPPPMVDASSDMLRKGHGVNLRRIRYDRFS